MKVAVLCEFSGRVRDAFLAQGHDAISCDLLPTEVAGPHIQGDCLQYDWEGYDLIVAHPPCTYLTNAGVRHLHSIPTRRGTLPAIHGEARWEEMRKAAKFFKVILGLPVARICVENPVPHHYAREIIGPYTQIIQPFQFGHGETKATCLWLKGLPPLKPTKIVDGRVPRIHFASPGPNRWKERSRTLPGIAEAMALQWGVTS